MEQSTWLVHHGVHGQRWRIRRYQNPDGSLTTLGRIHYGYARARSSNSSNSGQTAASSSGTNTSSAHSGSSSSSSSSGGQSNNQSSSTSQSSNQNNTQSNSNNQSSNQNNSGNNKKKKEDDPYKTASSAFKDAKNISDELSKMTGKSINKKVTKKLNKMDLSNMSDQDLRNYINRYNLEQQYKNLQAGSIAKGKRSLQERIDTVGSLLAVGVSAATLAGSIHKLRNRQAA